MLNEKQKNSKKIHNKEKEGEMRRAMDVEVQEKKSKTVVRKKLKIGKFLELKVEMAVNRRKAEKASEVLMKKKEEWKKMRHEEAMARKKKEKVEEELMSMLDQMEEGLWAVRLLLGEPELMMGIGNMQVEPEQV